MNPLSTAERKAWSETALRFLSRFQEQLSEGAAALYGCGSILSNVDLIEEAKAIWALRQRLASLSSLEYFPETPEEIPPPDETEPLPEGVTELQVEAVERGLRTAETKEDLEHYVSLIKGWGLGKESPRRIRLLQLWHDRKVELLKSPPRSREPGEDDGEGEEAPEPAADPLFVMCERCKIAEPIGQNHDCPLLDPRPVPIHSRDKAEINRDAAEVFQGKERAERLARGESPAPLPRSVRTRIERAERSCRETFDQFVAVARLAVTDDERPFINEAANLLLSCDLPVAEEQINAFSVSFNARKNLDSLVEARRAHLDVIEKARGS